MVLILPLALALNILSIFSFWTVSVPTAIKVILTIAISAKFICFALGALLEKRKISKILIIACASIGILSLIACLAMKATLTAVLLALLTIALMIWSIVTKYFSERTEKRV